ncbi:MAG TPA: DotU family type IV/VI secretion system protein [Terriglobia bacterium]|nr:DotU family type IV/VI secretion system protein [Terriglobia bacterium]
MGGYPSQAAIPQSPQPAPVQSRENLALIYQEVLTAITRFRSNRQAATDAGVFRNQMKAAIRAAESAAMVSRYPVEDTRLATFAVVAFLDESILNSNNPVFADWPRMPLQEELFGGHTAGEIFFHCVDRLLARSDTPQLADVLEVYALCLLLGYRGRYSLSGQEGIRTVLETIGDKIQRIRGKAGPLSPNWSAPQEAVQSRAYDPWLRRLTYGAVGFLLLAVVLFVGFKLTLSSGASGLHSTASVTTR